MRKGTSLSFCTSLLAEAIERVRIRIHWHGSRLKAQG
jgi:hypothetical protein